MGEVEGVRGNEGGVVVEVRTNQGKRGQGKQGQ